MRFYSTRSKSITASFEDAVLHGLAEDGGLYLPETIPVLDNDFLKQAPRRSFLELCAGIGKSFVEPEISAAELMQILEVAFDFEPRLVQLSDRLHVLELFHGPTLAFKDFGARFMAQVLARFASRGSKPVTVLVATSGDTGSAVASGFLGVPGINVVLLYPSGGVSEMQEKQLSTWGKNVVALEVQGDFDDCQRLVKQAFLDEELNEQIQLTSANSINVARLIPQSFYYFYAAARLPEQSLVFSVPCGNFGNLTAGILAAKMGLKISHFVAATNRNDAFVKFMENGVFKPKQTVRTISNSMDVGNPSNVERILALYDNDIKRISDAIRSFTFSDEQTLSAISYAHRNYDYLLDPHTAVAFCGARTYMDETIDKSQVVLLSTAHPAKFGDLVQRATGILPEMPPRLREVLDRPKLSLPFSADFSQLKQFLLQHQ